MIPKPTHWADILVLIKADSKFIKIHKAANTQPLSWDCDRHLLELYAANPAYQYVVHSHQQQLAEADNAGADVLR